MDCSEVRKRLTGMALDELDVEERREAEGHLASCAPCRAERESVERTMKALGGVPPVESSSTRRDRAVAALKEEHARRAEAAMFAGSRRGGWRAALAVAAAVLLVAAGASLVLFSQFGIPVELRAVEVSGPVRFLPAGSSEYRALEKGDVVRSGDHVLCGEGAQAEFFLRESGKRVGWIGIRPETTFLFRVEPGGRRRWLVLERGGFDAELGKAVGETRVSAPSGEDVGTRRGGFAVRFDGTLRMDGIAAPWRGKKNGLLKYREE